MDPHVKVTTVDWTAFQLNVDALTERVGSDGSPDAIVGILRGGMIPAILLAHALSVRTVRALALAHTTSDSVNASMSKAPEVSNVASLGNLANLDVLIVDDAIGTSHTLAVAKELVQAAGATRIRTLSCYEVAGYEKWQEADTADYVGIASPCWIVLPWERL